MADEDQDAPSRALRRARVAVPARIRGVEAEYVAVDLSLGGAFVAGAPQMPRGTIVEIELDFPEASFGCTGVVRWARSIRLGPNVREGMGIEFQGLDAVERERVRRMVEGE